MKQFEQNIAKRLGCKRHGMSGARWFQKNDFSSDRILGECKETDKKSISIRYEDLKILKERAYLSNRTPVFVFRVMDQVWLSIPIEDEQGKLLQSQD